MRSVGSGAKDNPAATPSSVNNLPRMADNSCVVRARWVVWLLMCDSRCWELIVQPSRSYARHTRLFAVPNMCDSSTRVGSTRTAQ